MTHKPAKPRIEREAHYWVCYTPFPAGGWRKCVDYPGRGLIPEDAYNAWLSKNRGAHPDTSYASWEHGRKYA